MEQKRLVMKQAGWENYTGPMYGIEFVEGKSVTPYSNIDAQRLGALIQIETEDGFNPSVAQQLVDLRMVPMDHDMVRNMETGELTTGTKLNEERSNPPRIWTIEELNAIADEKGIEGVRDVAAPMGLKGRGIAELISAILEKQGNKPKVDPNANIPAGN
jgi:hypothetical protein